MPSSLQNKKVFITRPVHSAMSLSRRLQDHGAQVFSVPMIEVASTIDAERFNSLSNKIESGGIRWIVFTSANGVRALSSFEGFPEHKERVANSWSRFVNVGVVGSRTAESAASFGLKVHLCPDVYTSSSLVEVFPHADDDQKVIAFLGELADDELQTGLTHKGYDVDRVTSYKTEFVSFSSESSLAIRKKIVAADFLLFFSPSAVNSLVDSFGPSGIAGSVICIGPKTASAAHKRGLSVAAVADTHTEDALVALVTSLAS